MFKSKLFYFFCGLGIAILALLSFIALALPAFNETGNSETVIYPMTTVLFGGVVSATIFSYNIPLLLAFVFTIVGVITSLLRTCRPLQYLISTSAFFLAALFFSLILVWVDLTQTVDTRFLVLGAGPIILIVFNIICTLASLVLLVTRMIFKEKIRG